MNQQTTGRAYQRGAARPAAKLTDDQIVTLRQSAARGAKQVDLAAEYGISQGLVSLIVNGKRWTHVGGPIRMTTTTTEEGI